MQPRRRRKKLIAWARWQAGAAPTSQHPAITGFKLWGEEGTWGDDIGPDYCAKACGGKRCARCPAPTLLPEAAPAALAYSVVRTQWRTGAGGRTGLDYTACAWVWATYRPRLALPADDELLEGVTVIEHAILQADVERLEADRGHRAARAIGSDDDTIGA